jgi:nitrogen fixation-related uncharacterized protein
MYYPYFILYMIVGFALSMAVLFWALRNGQFREQQRARFLPLSGGEEFPVPESSRFNRYEGCILVFLACVGILASMAVLAFSVLTAG